MSVTDTWRGRWDAADIAKYGMSIAVLAIHTSLFGELTYVVFPILRLAVPLFFMIGAVLFFRKLERGIDRAPWEEASSSLRKYLFRTARLYLFWFVALLLPTAYTRGWFWMEGFELILRVAIDVSLGSTFLASWYLSASAIAVSLIVLMRYKLGMRFRCVLAIGLVLYIVCLLSQPYRWVFGADGSLIIRQAIEATGVAPFNSFPVASFWTALGLGVVRLERCVRAVSSLNLVLVAIVGVFLMYLERLIICAIDPLLYSADVYLFLPVASTPLSLLLMRCSVRLDHGCSLALRRSSTVIYCLHSSLNGSIKHAVILVPGLALSDSICGAITFVLCQAVASALVRISERPGLSWLNAAW